MNKLTYWGLAFGGLVVVGYLCVAWRAKRAADLATAVNILISTVGAAGALRLIIFAFSDQFAETVAASPHGAVWSLAAEDAVFLVVGGIALGWASCQAVWRGFREL